MRCLALGLLVALGLSPGIAATESGAQAPGTINVTPDQGPVGITVAIEGSGCSDSGQSMILLFGGTGLPNQGTAGSSRVAGISVNPDGTFHTSFTIPAAIGPQQQWEGEPVVPGRYNFTSTPPYCQAFFTVTSELPKGGGRPGDGGDFTLITVGGAMLALSLLACAAALVRRGPHP